MEAYFVAILQNSSQRLQQEALFESRKVYLLNLMTLMGLEPMVKSSSLFFLYRTKNKKAK